MKHEFFIVSYYKDFPWLRHCLRSINKFCTGYGVTIVVPQGQIRAPLDYLEECPNIAFKQVKEDIEPEGVGQLFSQVTKCSADVFISRDCEFVHFIDSDCLVPFSMTPEMYFRDGKPIMPYNSYDHLRECGCGTAIWQEIVEKNLGFKPVNEFMRQMPMVYPRALFSALRHHVEDQHKLRFADYVFGTGKNSWPQLFCESNDLAAYAWEKMHDAYYWMNLDKGPENDIERAQVIQFWSHGGFDHPINRCFSPFKQWMVGQDLPEPHQTPRQVITDILGSF